MRSQWLKGNFCGESQLDAYVPLPVAINNLSGAVLLTQQHPQFPGGCLLQWGNILHASGWEMGCTHKCTCMCSSASVSKLQTLLLSISKEPFKHLAFPTFPGSSTLLLETSSLETLRRGQQYFFFFFFTAAWQPKQNVVLRVSKIEAHWHVMYRDSLGWSGSFLKNRRSKERE